MKKYYFLIIVTLIFGLFLTGCSLLSNISQVPATEQSGMTYVTKGTEAEPGSFPLYAGQHDLVGEVLVWDNGETLCVKYRLYDGSFGDPKDVVSDGWLIYETHLAIGTSLDDIPTNKSGNPKVGKFPYGDDDIGGEEFYEECISFEDLDVECGDELFIAAHAVVKKLGGLEGLELILPDQVGLSVSCPTGNNGYFDVTISGDTVLDGMYDGWCIDVDNEIECSDVFYTANVYSSYEEGLPECLVDYPENLDLVNYILNQSYIGENSVCDGVYTIGDVQRAIWTLLENDAPDPDEGEGEWLQCRVDEILDDAYTNGEGFEPICGEKAAVILAPIPECEIQVIIIIVDVPCEGDDTAWAAVSEGEIEIVEGKSWATYFNYTTCCWEEELTIPANGDKVTSTHSLTAGHTYQFVASGTCNWRAPGSANGYLADAEYWLRNDSGGTGWISMGIWSLAMWNGAAAENIDWGSPVDEVNHTYTIEYTPSADGQAIFFFNDDVYTDNSGSLTLNIYSCFDE